MNQDLSIVTLVLQASFLLPPFGYAVLMVRNVLGLHGGGAKLARSLRPYVLVSWFIRRYAASKQIKDGCASLHPSFEGVAMEAGGGRGLGAVVITGASSGIGRGCALHLEASGKRAIVYYRFQRVPTEQTYTKFDDKPRFEDVDEIANRYIASYVSGASYNVDGGWMAV